jgi:hypothetical protein
MSGAGDPQAPMDQRVRGPCEANFTGDSQLRCFITASAQKEIHVCNIGTRKALFDLRKSSRDY